MRCWNDGGLPSSCCPDQMSTRQAQDVYMAPVHAQDTVYVSLSLDSSIRRLVAARHVMPSEKC